MFYLDPAVPDLAESSEARALRRWRLPPRAGECARRRAGRLSGGVASQAARARTPVRVLQERHLAASTERALAFRIFRAEMGRALEQHAVFDALHEHALQPAGRGPGTTGRRRAPSGQPEVAAFAREHRERVDFFAYLQWLADQQLAAVQSARPPPACRSACTRTSPSGESGERHGLGQSRGHPERRQRGRAARLVQSARAELGPGAAFAGRPARGHARCSPRRCATTCAMPAPCASITSWGCSACSGSRRAPRRPSAYVRYPFADLAHHRARVGAPSLPGDRGSRHGAARLPRRCGARA